MMPHTRVRARSPLIARADELGHLHKCLVRAMGGHGSAVVISGEAGIGKSRLALELEDRARAADTLIMRLQCSALRSNRDFHPIQDYLIQFGGIRRTEPEALRRSKIQKLQPFADVGPMPGALLSGLVAIGGPSDPANVLPLSWRQRSDILDALLQGVADLAVLKPLLLIIEDAQWIDPSSNELLERLVRLAPAQRLLILVTARREFDPAWLGMANTSVVIPVRLKPAETLTLAMQVAELGELAPADLQEVVDRSEGVPFFVEELSKAKSVAGTVPAHGLKISANLQTLLMARLDHLGPAKRVAQVAAALGRRFSHDVAIQVWGGSTPEFAEMIAALMAAEVLLAKPIRPGSHYSFRHALYQEAAYASLLNQQRVDIHANIVRALKASALDIFFDQPEIIAHHSDRAESYGSAARDWLAAGKAAAARGSAIEAVNLFKLGLDAASRSPDDDQRARLEFELNMNLGPALMAIKGYASPEGLETFLGARRLIRWSQSSLEELQVLVGLFNVHFGRGEYAQALDVGHQADRSLAVGFGGYPVLIGQAQCMMGNFVEAQRSLELAIARYNPTLDAQSGLFCRADVVATSFLAKTEFARGHLDRATELTQATMDLAQQDGHPLALAIAYLGQLFLATDAGDLPRAQQLADDALAHASRHNLDNYRLWVAFHRSALSLRSNPSGAIASMHQLLEKADAAGTLMFRPAQLGLLGAGYAATGQREEALILIGQGLEVARQTQGMEAAPALHRLRARTLLETSPAAAITELETSLALARGQSAHMEELRSATVLARLLKDTDRRGYAADLLTGIYAGITQGRHFPDLQQAGRVLASFGAHI